MNTIDWDEVRKFVAERNPVSVDAGILNDWFWTGATVYENGEWKDLSQAWTRSPWGDIGFKATMPNGDVIEKSCARKATDDELADFAEDSKRIREKTRKMAEELMQKSEVLE